MSVLQPLSASCHRHFPPLPLRAEAGEFPPFIQSCITGYSVTRWKPRAWPSVSCW